MKSRTGFAWKWWRLAKAVKHYDEITGYEHLFGLIWIKRVD